ncbi:MAG: hypothetical protein DSY42_04930 [Aquifex sp.]|nr:MAG: hypothetical protein DSY42_04930 [Aquifex sp.]
MLTFDKIRHIESELKKLYGEDVFWKIIKDEDVILVYNKENDTIEFLSYSEAQNSFFLKEEIKLEDIIKRSKHRIVKLSVRVIFKVRYILQVDTDLGEVEFEIFDKKGLPKKKAVIREGMNNISYEIPYETVYEASCNELQAIDDRKIAFPELSEFEVYKDVIEDKIVDLFSKEIKEGNFTPVLRKRETIYMPRYWRIELVDWEFEKIEKV